MTRALQRKEADISPALIAELSAHKFNVEREFNISIGGTLKRCDLVVWRWGSSGLCLFGVEVKRPEVVHSLEVVMQVMRYGMGQIVDKRLPQWQGMKLPAVLLYPGKFPLWRLGERVTLAQNDMGLLRPDVEHAGLTVGFGETEVPVRRLYRSGLFRPAPEGSN